MLQAHRVGETLKERLTILRQLLWSSKNGLQTPTTVSLARAVTRGCQGRDVMCELRAIYQFVVTNMRYTGDVSTVDTFSAPLRALQMGGGDCDEHMIVNAALAIANGFQCKARVTSNRGVTWDHIYCMAGLPKGRGEKWVALDTTLAKHQHDFGRFGHEPPRAKYQDFPLGKP